MARRVRALGRCAVLVLALLDVVPRALAVDREDVDLLMSIVRDEASRASGPRSGSASGEQPAPTGLATTEGGPASSRRPGPSVIHLLGGLMVASGPEMDGAERAAMDRLVAVMPKLAGADGRLDRGDVDAIVASVEGDLAGEVEAEISRQLDARVRPGEFGCWLRRLVAAIYMRRHGDERRASGMEEARRKVRQGLGLFFEGAGTTESSGVEDRAPRGLSLAELRQFGEDARVLQRISARARERGVPRFTFPQGMSAADVKAIRDGRVPPGGRLEL